MIKIEHSYKEEHYLVGETIYDNGAVELKEQDKKSYVMQVTDEVKHEVQVRKYGTKSMKTTCSCEEYSQQKSCPHAVAALLYIRANTPTKTKAPKQLAYNVNSILTQLTREEMLNFIKLQARKDKAFNYMLKAKYANKVQLADNSVKYSSILHTIIKPVADDATRSLTSDIRLAVRVIHEFSDQLDDALAEGDYTTAFEIMRGIWGKIHYLYRHYKGSRKYVGSTLLKLSTHVEDMYKAGLAPRLLAEVDELVVAVTSLSYYNFLDPSVEVVQCLYKYRRVDAMQALQEHIMSKDGDAIEEQEVNILYALSVLLDSPTSISVTDQQLIQSSQLLQRWDANAAAVALLETRYEADPSRNRTIEYALVDTLHNCDRADDAVNLAVHIFVTHREFRYLRKLKEMQGGTLTKETEALISTKLTAMDGRYRYKALYYRDIEDISNLLATLQAAKDMQLLMEHDAYLYRREPTQLIDVYISAVDTYLAAHVGGIAASFITEVLSHLDNIGAFKVKTTLTKHITQQYKHRIGLVDYK